MGTSKLVQNAFYTKLHPLKTFGAQASQGPMGTTPLPVWACCLATSTQC